MAYSVYGCRYRYRLQNGNSGLQNHSYYDREKYQAKFELLWQKFQEMGLANKDLLQLRNTDLFKFSPYKALTDEQIEIVERIKTSLINGEHKTHIIHGEPGTGKSVLATYLAKYLQSYDSTKNLKVALVIPQSGLRKSLKKVFSKVAGLSSNMVLGPNEIIRKNFDLIIVDEAHRLNRRVNLSGYGPFDKANKHYNLGNDGTQLDWILLSSASQVHLYDENQSVMPKDVRKEDFIKLRAMNYTLTSQLRVLAGNDYIEFMNNLLAVNVSSKPNFGDYDLRYFDNLQEMITEIKRKDSEHGLARLVAGYAWPWKTKSPSTHYFDIELDGLKLKWNSTLTDWVNSKNAIDEVGCIHTVQGYDLNYVGVIIGPEVSYDPINKKMAVDKDKYMDFNGKRTLSSQEELEMYIINIYKTLLTRGIKGTFIHAVDKHLEAYLKARLA